MRKQPDMEFHKLAQMVPQMTEAQFSALKADIEENGLLDAITLFEGKILDGRNRYRACIELDVRPVFEAFEGKDAEAFVISKNLKRRHMTPEQQRAMAEARRKKVTEMRAKGMSQRRIAEELGIPKSTVDRDLAEGAPRGAPEPPPSKPEAKQPEPDKVTGRDGKKYPSKQRVKKKTPPGLKDIPRPVAIPRATVDSSEDEKQASNDLRDVVKQIRETAESFRSRGGLMNASKKWEKQRRLEVAAELDALARIINGIVQELKAL